MSDKIDKSEAEWRKELSAEEFEVCRKKGTERAFTGALVDNKEAGTYLCRCCDEELFASETKYESHSGWPSFYEPAAPGKIEETEDMSAGMMRTEVTCQRCGSHLGHVFPDGPQPTGQRYCINSVSLKFKEE
jgi:peptide-methionine (R)-S-oxide reductase